VAAALLRARRLRGDRSNGVWLGREPLVRSCSCPPPGPTRRRSECVLPLAVRESRPPGPGLAPPLVSLRRSARRVGMSKPTVASRSRPSTGNGHNVALVASTPPPPPHIPDGPTPPRQGHRPTSSSSLQRLPGGTHRSPPAAPADHSDMIGRQILRLLDLRTSCPEGPGSRSSRAQSAQSTPRVLIRFSSDIGPPASLQPVTGNHQSGDDGEAVRQSQ
jgi:hypothetical protein